MATIGVGVIGCGDIARVRYFPSIAALPELSLAGLYSRTPAACAPIARQYGGAIHADLAGFLADPAIEAVVVASPHPSHAELTVRALEAGKHVLTEKPIATSLADAERIRRAAAGSDRVFMALPFDAMAPMDAARSLVESGAIGRINSADAVLAHHGPMHAAWFFDRDQAGWGVLADLGIYLISQLVYLFGPAESVVGRVETVFPERALSNGETCKATVDDNIAGVITWPGAMLGSVRANWCSPADARNFIWETRVYGTDGVIFVNMAAAGNNLVVFSPGRPIEGAEKVVHNGLDACYRPTLAPWDLHLDILRAFAEAIAGGRAAEMRLAAARQHHVIEVIAKLYESSLTGTARTLDTTF